MKRISKNDLIKRLGEQCESGLYESLSSKLNEFSRIENIKNDNSNLNTEVQENHKSNSNNICLIKNKNNDHDLKQCILNDPEINDNESIKEFPDIEESAIGNKLNFYHYKINSSQISPQCLFSHQNSTNRNSPLQNSIPRKITYRKNSTNSNQNINLSPSSHKMFK